jgi:23S rRNA (uracil1939-C5)-methyltransferase
MDSTRFMREAQKFHKRYDAIILDPPRAGTSESFIESACALRPGKILYISCDPKTQARDLIAFKRQGYLTDKIELVDMFPKTEHIESLCVLTYRPRKKPAYRKDVRQKDFQKGKGRPVSKRRR